MYCRLQDEDYLEEMRQQLHEERRIRRNLSCADRMCGADDCPTCRPGSFWFTIITEEED